jgi:hypothetical protein
MTQSKQHSKHTSLRTKALQEMSKAIKERRKEITAEKEALSAK